jgi:hypothetical protein
MAASRIGVWYHVQPEIILDNPGGVLREITRGFGSSLIGHGGKIITAGTVATTDPTPALIFFPYAHR